MRHLLFIILFSILVSCGTNDANNCPELVFIEFVSYQGFESYRFEGNRFYSSKERLNLNSGQVYQVCTRDGEIIEISKP